MGTYGFLRFSLPLLPDSAKNPTIINIMALLSIIAIVYGALACLMQKDWKKLVAYSSVSHLGFCTLGIFALNPAGIAGSIIQQINHGISTGMLFLIVGVVYERRHTRAISEYGGLLRVMPLFTIIFLIAALSSMGMLGSGGDRARGRVLAVAFPAHHARRDQGKEPEVDRSLVARDCGVCAVGGLGFLDRAKSASVLPGAGAARGADRGARAAGVLRRAAPGESAGSAEPPLPNGRGSVTAR
jgi:hypothetical protein